MVVSDFIAWRRNLNIYRALIQLNRVLQSPPSPTGFVIRCTALVPLNAVLRMCSKFL